MATAGDRGPGRVHAPVPRPAGRPRPRVGRDGRPHPGAATAITHPGPGRAGEQAVRLGHRRRHRRGGRGADRGGARPQGLVLDEPIKTVGTHRSRSSCTPTWSSRSPSRSSPKAEPGVGPARARPGRRAAVTWPTRPAAIHRRRHTPAWDDGARVPVCPQSMPGLSTARPHRPTAISPGRCPYRSTGPTRRGLTDHGSGLRRHATPRRLVPERGRRRCRPVGCRPTTSRPRSRCSAPCCCPGTPSPRPSRSARPTTSTSRPTATSSRPSPRSTARASRPTRSPWPTSCGGPACSRPSAARRCSSPCRPTRRPPATPPATPGSSRSTPCCAG